MYTNLLPEAQLQERSQPKKYDLRGEYYRDQTAIIHSRPFRRLKHKTQVFFSPHNDHVCTRIEHVLHVATIAASICKGLNQRNDEKWKLNEELAYSIGIGHDLGHPPFGHAGEQALDDMVRPVRRFIHEINGYRVIEKVYNFGEGMNLTYAVKDGIICHCGEKFEQKLEPEHKLKNLNLIQTRANTPSTYEGCIVRFADKIAYLGRDIEDALIGKFITKDQIPANIQEKIGSSNGEIINYLVNDIIKASNRGIICFSDETYQLFLELKTFNYQCIYTNEKVKEYEDSCKNIVQSLYNFYMNLLNSNGLDQKLYASNSKKIVQNFGAYLYKMNPFYTKEKSKHNLSDLHTYTNLVMDYISGMTDNYAIYCMKEINIPSPIL